MGYIAKWGPKGFVVSPKKIITLSDLSTSLTLKTDSQNDTSGTAPTNTRGRELRPINFSVVYSKATGADPRAQLEEWEKLLGKQYPLYIGEKRFGAASMMLTAVNSADIILSAKGEFLSVTVSITLEEVSTTSTAQLSSTTSGKQSATKATASLREKAEKSPYK